MPNETYTITFHTRDELPPRFLGGSQSIEVFAEIYNEKENFHDFVHYDFYRNSWRLRSGEVPLLLLWFEKPPVQKKKERRELTVKILKRSETEFCVTSILVENGFEKR